MKITAPLDSVSETVQLINAGAAELYCGVYDDKWKREGFFSNARHMFYGNLKTFDDLSQVVSIASRYDVPVYLCVNEYHTQAGSSLLREDIRTAIDSGVQGLILADFTLIPFIRSLSKDVKLILSSLTPCFNAAAVRFFFRKGFKRLVLPLSQMTYGEIEGVVCQANKLGMEIEIFANNVTCKNVNGFCLYHNVHIETFYEEQTKRKRSEVLQLLKWCSSILPVAWQDLLGKILWSSKIAPPLGCRAAADIIVKKHADDHDVDLHHKIALERDFAQDYCMLCLLFKVFKLGIAAGKITGRGSLTSKKIKDVSYLKKYLALIEDGVINENNFKEMNKRVLWMRGHKECNEAKCASCR